MDAFFVGNLAIAITHLRCWWQQIFQGESHRPTRQFDIWITLNKDIGLDPTGHTGICNTLSVGWYSQFTQALSQNA